MQSVGGAAPGLPALPGAPTTSARPPPSPPTLPPQVMDALYQVRSRRRATDTQLDQLREACATLAGEHRVKEAARIDRQLEELRGRWEALKKAAPQVGGLGAGGSCAPGPAASLARSLASMHEQVSHVLKPVSPPILPPRSQVRASIQAAQEAEGARVKADIQRFGAAVEQVRPAACAARVRQAGGGAGVAAGGSTPQPMHPFELSLARLPLLALLQYVGAIYAKRGFFAWATGVEAALADVDKARAGQWGRVMPLALRQRELASATWAAPLLATSPFQQTLTHSSPPLSSPLQTSQDLEAMRTERGRLEALAKLFDASELLAGASAAIDATAAELAALGAVWRTAAATQARLAEANQTLFAAVDVAALEEEAKALVKEVNALPKEVKEQGGWGP